MKIEGSEKAPPQLSGPASRAAEHGPEADVGEASETDSQISDSASDANEDACQPCLADANANVATACIAVDPVHDLAPVKMMQALQGQIEVLHNQAETIAQRERKQHESVTQMVFFRLSLTKAAVTSTRTSCSTCSPL